MAIKSSKVLEVWAIPVGLVISWLKLRNLNSDFKCLHSVGIDRFASRSQFKSPQIIVSFPCAVDK